VFRGAGDGTGNGETTVVAEIDIIGHEGEDFLYVGGVVCFGVFGMTLGDELFVGMR
jgi:hypothetical protein